ncbi:hypothetical protein ACIRP2_38055 [Streptomyces sp. NPDC101194]|uniref:hypothetical protein n=1 Tax=Streptomyces sp. NPDC101194 TaxID=3366127 RepID=UPI00381B14D3
MTPHGNPAPLAQARRRDSIDKRRRVLTAIERLEHDGTPITHTAVARTAGVSTWLTYAEGLREHVRAAQTRRDHYREALEELIAAKAEGKAPPEPAEEGEGAPGGVIDLMAALNASVKKARESRGEGEHIHEMKPRKKAAAKKAPDKKTAAKKTSSTSKTAAKKAGARKPKSA